MNNVIISTAKDVLVWLVVLVSSAGDFDIPPDACGTYMDHFLKGADAKAILAVTSPDESSLAAYVEALGSDEYALRRKAEDFLLAAGAEAAPYLKKAAEKIDDPHVRF